VITQGPVDRVSLPAMIGSKPLTAARASGSQSVLVHRLREPVLGDRDRDDTVIPKLSGRALIESSEVFA
jgi:hypothetical protein